MRDFIPLLSGSPSYDVRMFANKATFSAIDAELEQHNEKLIRTTESEEEYLSNLLMRPWGDDGLSLWLDLMAGKGEAAEHQLEMLRRIWSVHPFEVIGIGVKMARLPGFWMSAGYARYGIGLHTTAFIRFYCYGHFWHQRVSSCPTYDSGRPPPCCRG